MKVPRLALPCAGQSALSVPACRIGGAALRFMQKAVLSPSPVSSSGYLIRSGSSGTT